MKNLSVKDLKKSTRRLYNFNGAATPGGETTVPTTGGDPTTTTITVLTTTHLK